MADKEYADAWKEGEDGEKEVWDKERPKDLGEPKRLTPAQKSAAKQAAAKAGRPYPNLVDNMRAAKGGK